MSVARIFKTALAAIETFVSNMPTRERDDLLADAGIDLAQGTLRVARKGLYFGLHKRHAFRFNPTFVLVLIAIGDKALLNSAEEGSLPLCHWAAAQEDDAVLRALLQAGMRVDGKATPVVAAASNPNDAVIRALLAAGAVVDDDLHETAYHAANNPNERVIQALIEGGIDLALCGKPLLSVAAGNRNLLVLRAILASGIDATKDPWAVASAAGNPSELAVELLLAVGAMITREAVARASGNTNERVIKALIHAGAPCDAADTTGDTPCHIAAQNRNSRVLISLLAAGVDVNAVNLHLRTPVHEALLAHNVDAVRVFLAAGVDLPRDRYESAFQMCAKDTAVGENVECAHLLLAAGYELRDDDLDRVWHAFRPQWEAAVRDEARIAAAKASIKKQHVDSVRWRAMEICVGLQSLRINALQLCEILEQACAPLSQPMIPFHTLWNIATAVKHFRQTSDEDESA